MLEHFIADIVWQFYEKFADRHVHLVHLNVANQRFILQDNTLPNIIFHSYSYFFHLFLGFLAWPCFFDLRLRRLRKFKISFSMIVSIALVIVATLALLVPWQFVGGNMARWHAENWNTASAVLLHWKVVDLLICFDFRLDGNATIRWSS